MQEDETNKIMPKLAGEQYVQYHEIRRQINGFSWQIPSIAAIVIVLMLGFDPEKTAYWIKYPLTPAIGLIVIAMFMFVMLVNLIRNIAFLRNFEIILAQFENDYGEKVFAYAKDLDRNFRYWQRLRSSTVLGIFLVIMIVITFLGSCYFWIRCIMLMLGK